ncbi:MAG TPA: C25 family cysteine peptidase [Clostridiales bacterium]|nr:C25 family cysteine peptidase [Clostridiales bacterium]HQP70952.1 C25 family cysteine peptidase [Clostridiales bacterium]
MNILTRTIIMATILMSGSAEFLLSADFSVSHKQNSINAGEILFIVNDFKTETVFKNGQYFSRIVFDGSSVLNKKGFAEIPRISAAVQIGDKNDAVLSAEYGDYTELKLDHPLLPSRGVIYRDQDPDRIPYETDPASVKDEMYPSYIYDHSDPYIFRDIRGVNVSAYPFAYNSEKRILRVYKSIKINYSENKGASSNPLTIKPQNLTRTMSGIYRSLFINYKEPKFAHQIGEEGDILVICTPRDSSVIQPYIDWKRQRGFKVTKSVVAALTNVKSLIAGAYVSNPEILYVQLVGDWSDIKSDLGTEQNAPMDPMLGCVAGTDIYPEIIIGRFSAGSNSDVTTMVNKTIAYERDPDLTATWYKYGLGIGSNEGSGIGDDGEIDYDHIDIIKENKLLPTTYSTVNEQYGTSASASQVANFVNSGLGIINYCGHGAETFWVTSSYSSTNVNNSTNGLKLPVIFSVACVNGAFHSGTCFAEAWLRKSGGGAAATLMSTINQAWVPPMKGQDYMNDILTGGYDYSANPGNGTNTTKSDQRTTFGSVALNGCVLMLAEGYSDKDAQETIQTWTVFGDASLQVRTDTPELIENTNNAVFPEAYSTRILSGGSPVAGARVTLSQNGVNFSAVTDANGDATIYHSIPDGEVIITVTGFNLETKQTAVNVHPPEGPYLKVNSYSFSSAYYGTESVMNLNIKNIGLESSSGITLKAICESPYISFINDSCSYSDLTILSDGSWLNNEISFSIDPLVPDQENIKLHIEMTDTYSKRSYGSDIYLRACSPVLSSSHSFNQQSALQGQTQPVIFRIENKGHAPVYDLNVSIDQLTGFDVTITDPVKIDSIEAGSFSDVQLECYYSDNIPNSSFIRYKMTAVSGSGQKLEYDYDVVVGLTDGFESGDFTKNGWALSGDVNWIADSTVVYEGSYSACSGPVGDGQSSELSLTLTFIVDGNLAFYRKISSETGYDKLSFYIDGSLIKSWSGNSDWTKVEYGVVEGAHEFKWIFSRDASMGFGSNCVWIDNVLATGISTTGINSNDDLIPETAVLYQNYPNPFNPVTQIRFAIQEAGDVNLRVYNVSGQLVSELTKGTMVAGIHSVEFDGSRLNSGVYYYTLETDGISVTKKFVLMK